MTREEFESQLKELSPIPRIPNEEEYKLISFVYTFHPSISETDGKRQVALLYHEFGIRIFKDMENTASRYKELEDAIIRTKQQLRNLEYEADRLRKEAR